MSAMRGMMWAGFERFSFHVKRSDALACSQPGKDADADVRAVLAQPYIAKQLNAIPAAKIAAELKEYGAWDEAELADSEANQRRILWLAACNIREEGNA